MRLLFFFFLFATTVPHQATLYYQSSACTDSSPCRLVVYRAVCSTSTTCPSYGNGHGWIQVTAGSASSAPTPTGTTWVVTDKDPTLQDATTYVYVATLAWQSNPNQASAPGPAWSGTTASGATSNVPATPTVGTGNSVQ